MREASGRLMERDRVRRDVFLRGRPEGLCTNRRSAWQCDLFTLLRAYGEVRARAVPAAHNVAERMIVSLEQALARPSTMLAGTTDWTRLDAFLSGFDIDAGDSRKRRSPLAPSFAAALELACPISSAARTSSRAG